MAELKYNTENDARSLPLLNLCKKFGNQGTKLFTKYPHNFKANDYVWIDRGLLSNITLTSEYDYEYAKFNTGYKVLWVDAKRKSLAIAKPFDGNSSLFSQNETLLESNISSNFVVNGIIEKATVYDGLFGLKTGNASIDNDYKTANNISYLTANPSLGLTGDDGFELKSGIITNGNLYGGTLSGGKFNNTEFVVKNQDVFPHIINANTENVFTYSQFIQGNFFDGTFGQGVAERIIFHQGIFKNGYFKGGQWISGTFLSGTIEAYNNRLEIEDIDFKDGIAKNLIWRGGIWNTGEWKGNELIIVKSIDSYLSKLKVSIDLFFINHFVVGDLCILNGATLKEDNAYDINNKPLYVDSIDTINGIVYLTPSDDITVEKIISNISSGIIKITNSCWNSGIWNNGIWRSGIKSDSSYYIYNTLSGPTTAIKAFRPTPMAFPLSGATQLNYEFRSSEINIGEQAFIWNLTGSTGITGWSIASAITGTTNPIKDFTINLIPQGNTNGYLTNIIDDLYQPILDLSCWKDGIWESGLYQGGIWKSGNWYSGVFYGIWESGNWYSGEKRSGWFEKGNWYAGKHINSIDYRTITTPSDYAGYYRDVVINNGFPIYHRGFYGSSVIASANWYNGYFGGGTIKTINWKNGIYSQGSQFQMNWESGQVLSDSPYDYTSFQKGYFLYNKENEIDNTRWASRIDGITTSGGKIHYILQNGNISIAYDDVRLLANTGPLRTTAKTFAGLTWKSGDFNTQGNTTPSDTSAVLLKGQWKSGTWYNGSFSPVDDIEVWDKDTLDPLSTPYYTGVYNHRWINYDSYHRHNVFSSGSWITGTFYNGTILGGSFQGGTFEKMYAISDSNDIDFLNTNHSQSTKFIVERMGWDNTYSITGGTYWYIKGLGINNVGLTTQNISYSNWSTSNAIKKHDIINIPTVFTPFKTDINNITSSSINQLVISIDLGTVPNVTIQTNSYIEIRGLVKRGKGIAPNGFHKVILLSDGINTIPYATTGVVYITIQLDQNTSELIKGLDFNNAYLNFSNSFITESDYNTYSDTIKINVNGVITGNSYYESFTTVNENGILNIPSWIHTRKTKPSVHLTGSTQWIGISNNMTEIYPSADMGIYSSYASESLGAIRFNNSTINSMMIEGKSDGSISNSIINHSYIDLNTVNNNVKNTIINSKTHSFDKLEKTQLISTDEFGFLNNQGKHTSTSWGISGPYASQITGISILGSYSNINFLTTVTGMTGYQPYSSGDLLFLRGIFGNTGNAFGGGYSRPHLFTGPSGIMTPYPLRNTTGQMLTSGNNLTFYAPYDGKSFTYQLGWASAISFDGVEVDGSGYGSILNKGKITGNFYNGAVFTDPQRNAITGETAYATTGVVSYLTGSVYQINISNVVKPNILYSLELAEEKYNKLDTYFNVTGITSVIQVEKVLSDTDVQDLTNQPVKLTITPLRYNKIIDNTLKAQGEPNKIWNTNSDKNLYLEQSYNNGANLVDTVWYGGNWITGQLQQSSVGQQLNSAWINGIWNNGSLIGQLNILTGTSYPQWTNLMPWWGGFWNNGEFYGGLWTRGQWNGGRFDSGLWESYDASVGITYDPIQSSWNSGIFRSVELQPTTGYVQNPSASIWLGGQWNGSSMVSTDYYSDPLQDYAQLMNDSLAKASWNGPFTEYDVDDLRKVILPGSSSVWLGGKWLRGQFDGGIFYNGQWWSSDRAISGPYPINSYYCSPDYATNTTFPFQIGNTGQDRWSQFKRGAFVASVWEGGIFGQRNTGPTGPYEQSQFWRSTDYETIFGWYIPQDRNLSVDVNQGWSYSNHKETTLSKWVIDDSPYIAEFQLTDTSSTNVFEWRYYKPNTLTTKRLFAKDMYIPSDNVNPTWQANGLSEDNPQGSYWKRGLWNGGVAQWSLFDALAHDNTSNDFQNWNLSQSEYHLSDINSYAVKESDGISNHQSSLPSLAFEGYWLNCFWNLGIMRVRKNTFNNSIWVNGVWSDPELEKSIPYDILNPFATLALTGPANLTTPLGIPNSLPVDFTTPAATPLLTWDYLITGITGGSNYNTIVKIVSSPSYANDNTLFYNNFHRSIWYAGLWDRGRFQLSVWNSYAPGINSSEWIFDYTPFKGSTSLPYNNFVYQFSSVDGPDRFDKSNLKRYEVVAGEGPMGYIDLVKQIYKDETTGNRINSSSALYKINQINKNFSAVFKTHAEVSDTPDDGRYRVFPIDNFVTQGDFYRGGSNKPWFVENGTNGNIPTNILITDGTTDELSNNQYIGLVFNFTSAYLARVLKYVSYTGSNPISQSLSDAIVGTNLQDMYNGSLILNPNGSVWNTYAFPDTNYDNAYTSAIRLYAIEVGVSMANIYQQAYNSIISSQGSGSYVAAHAYAVQTVCAVNTKTLFSHDNFDEQLSSDNRTAGNVDNFVSRWNMGQFLGSIWNGGIWETGEFIHKSVNGDGYLIDYFGDVIPSGNQYTAISVWTRGIWKSGIFSTRDLSDVGITNDITLNKKSYKKSLFMSLELPVPDTEFTRNYNENYIIGVDEVVVKSQIEYPVGQLPTTVLTSVTNNDIILNDTYNLSSWFSRTKKIVNTDYISNLEYWFGALPSYRQENPHLFDWHYWSEFNGVMLNGVFLDLFKKGTYIMDGRGIPQRTPLFSSFAEWGNRPSVSNTRKNDIRKGTIYGNQRYDLRWYVSTESGTTETKYFKLGLNDQKSYTELSTGPFYYPFFLNSRTVMRFGPDTINDYTSDDYSIYRGEGLTIPNKTFYGTTIPDAYVYTPGVPAFSATIDFAVNPTTGIYYTDGSQLKNTFRKYSTEDKDKVLPYYMSGVGGYVKDNTGITYGTESLYDNTYLSSRKYYFDWIKYDCITGPSPLSDTNYANSSFLFDSMTTIMSPTTAYSDAVLMPYGTASFSTGVFGAFGFDYYKYGGLTGRPEERFIQQARLFPQWSYHNNNWNWTLNDIINYGSWLLKPYYFGETKNEIKSIYSWIPTTGFFSVYKNNLDILLNSLTVFINDYNTNNIADRDYNYAQIWRGFDVNDPPTDSQQTVLHYNFGDGYTWIYPKVIFSDLFAKQMVNIPVGIINDENQTYFMGTDRVYSVYPLVNIFDYNDIGVTSLSLRKK